VISARILAKFGLSLERRGHIYCASAHSRSYREDQGSLFLPCVLFVASIADELARYYTRIGLYNGHRHHGAARDLSCCRTTEVALATFLNAPSVRLTSVVPLSGNALHHGRQA
jgi:hypothetical protein